MGFRLPEPAVPLHLVEDGGELPEMFLPLSGTASRNGRVSLGGKDGYILMSSYSYLGLNGHPAIAAAAAAAAEGEGTGIHGSRLVSGTLRIHRQLERRLAEISGQEDSILFSSGYVSNLATISALVGPGDMVFCDVLNHASIQDGCRMSGADVVVCAHNNPGDLARKLARAESEKNKLIVLDAVYSMEGDVPDLPRILELARHHGALVMVNEAHSFGVLGKSGHGIEEHFGIAPGSIPIKMGTLSKTIPSIGGYVASSRAIVRLLRYRARGYIFSSALPAPCTAAALAALDVIEAEPWRIERLQANADHLRQRLRAAGISTLRSTTAVIPALCGETEAALQVSRFCYGSKVLAMPITYPAVQRHLARLRLIPTACHSLADLDRVVDVIVEAFDAAGIGRSPVGAPGDPAGERVVGAA